MQGCRAEKIGNDRHIDVDRGPGQRDLYPAFSVSGEHAPNFGEMFGGSDSGPVNERNFAPVDRSVNTESNFALRYFRSRKLGRCSTTPKLGWLTGSISSRSSPQIYGVHRAQSLNSILMAALCLKLHSAIIAIQAQPLNPILDAVHPGEVPLNLRRAIGYDTVIDTLSGGSLSRIKIFALKATPSPLREYQDTARPSRDPHEGRIALASS